MNRLNLGIDLTDRGCTMAWYHSEKNAMEILMDREGRSAVPSYLALNPESGRWSIGHDAKQLQGNSGYLVFHRILSLFFSQSSLEVNSNVFTSDEMMMQYMKGVFLEAKERSGIWNLGQVVICAEGFSISDYDRLTGIILSLEPDAVVHIYNREECFMYYLMSHKRDIWSNTSFLFDYGPGGLDCYELNQLKGCSQVTVHTAAEHREDAPLFAEAEYGTDRDAERDRWFSDLAAEKLNGKIVSSVIVSGAGFSNLSWAKEFFRTIKSQKSRKIFQVDHLFALGAGYAANHIAAENRGFPYICICRNRLSTTVSIMVDHQEHQEQIILAREGENCFESRTSMELNLIEMNTVDILVRNTGSASNCKITCDLSDFMADGRARTKIRLMLVFPEENKMAVRIEDMGLGELFPSTGQIYQNVFQI